MPVQLSVRKALARRKPFISRTVMGRDIEPSARTSKRVSFSYRTYRNGQQIERLPSKTMIRDALLEAQSNVLIIPTRKQWPQCPKQGDSHHRPAYFYLVRHLQISEGVWFEPFRGVTVPTLGTTLVCFE
jgi:hypothetical protein